MKWPQQDDEGIKETNIGILNQILGLLYETHITEQETASLRGNAIQSVSAMLEHFGVTGAISEQESISFSERRRNSEIWNKDGE